MTTCQTCGTEIDREIADSNAGYCDDCVLETMDPEWVKEHYPDCFPAEEPAPRRNAKARTTRARPAHPTRKRTTV